ncbi:hypothetical protein ATO00_11315 [Loigolactobacillus coryniformis subsp. coryniformis]|nr:hypothetical protein ATO00_11315 [Loigolactobacillus coryniformis subsp. coryniformis]
MLKHAKAVIATTGNFLVNPLDSKSQINKFFANLDARMDDIAPDEIAVELISSIAQTNIANNEFAIVKFLNGHPCIVSVTGQDFKINTAFGSNFFWGQSDSILRLFNYDRPDAESVIQENCSLKKATEIVKFQIETTVKANQYIEPIAGVGGLPQIYQITKNRITKLE